MTVAKALPADLIDSLLSGYKKHHALVWDASPRSGSRATA